MVKTLLKLHLFNLFSHDKLKTIWKYLIKSVIVNILCEMVSETVTIHGNFLFWLEFDVHAKNEMPKALNRFIPQILK